jgi:hypothetical protein
MNKQRVSYESNVVEETRDASIPQNGQENVTDVGYVGKEM